MRAPQILRELADLIVSPIASELAILDLGCGTGLAGVAFSDMAARLDGIDLSPAMIEKARAREHLRRGSGRRHRNRARRNGPHLRSDPCRRHARLSGRSGASACAPPRSAFAGRCIFSSPLKRKDGDGFELGPKRRWRHSEAYLRDESDRAGLSVAGFLECSPRTEAKQPVEGYAVALERRAPR